MPKADISMTPEEVVAFLSRTGTMVIGTIDADGWPTGTLARANYTDGSLTIDLDAHDPVGIDVARTNALCCVADEHETYFDIRGVIVHGRPGERRGSTLAVDVRRIVSFDFGRIPK
jgi:hypothetical protein